MPRMGLGRILVCQTPPPPPGPLYIPDGKQANSVCLATAQLSSLISNTGTDFSSAIEALPYSSFDPRGQYASVREAVRVAATGEEVKVYQVGIGGARVEYYVLGLDGKGRRVVGLRARAVES